MVKISIISVTFNNLPGLIRTCASIDRLPSTSLDGVILEHLVIDGASTDASRDFLRARSLVAQPMFFRFISEPDRGIYDAMNKGLSLANGDYLVFLNAGDEVSPDFCLSGFRAEMLNELANPRSAGLAFSALVRYGCSKRRQVVARAVDNKNPRLPTVHQSMFYKRSLLLNYGFRVNLAICGDYENFARIFADGFSFKSINEVFSVFGADGVSARSPIRLFAESSRITWSLNCVSWIYKIRATIRLALSLIIHSFWVFIFGWKK